MLEVFNYTRYFVERQLAWFFLTGRIMRLVCPSVRPSVSLICAGF